MGVDSSAWSKSKAFARCIRPLRVGVAQDPIPAISLLQVGLVAVCEHPPLTDALELFRVVLHDIVAEGLARWLGERSYV